MYFWAPQILPDNRREAFRDVHAQQVERLAAAERTLIQLREKVASPREFYQEH